jgi:dienelactone hydrolase
MLNFFQPTHNFGFQVLRLVAEAQQGGGDVFDIARLCASLELDDKTGWERGWLALAESTESKAKEALAAGRKQTAIDCFFHANQYYRMSDVYLTAAETAKKRQRFLKVQENFRAAARLHWPPIEVITVRCGAEEYDGYFCHPVNPKPGRWPAVFLIGGADSYAEEIYFGGRAALARGCALLLVDTPGRGSAHYVREIPTRPDYEVPSRSCIDYLVSRPEVDPERIGLMGISMAGYYAPRAAAFDHRIRALVCWSGCYSILDDLYLFYPPLQPTLQRILGGVTDAEARDRLAAFTMAGLAQNIRCPTLITHGAEDRLMNVEGAKRLFAELGCADKTLKIYDDPKTGGTIHCSHDYWVQNVPFMMDWLGDRL